MKEGTLDFVIKIMGFILAIPLIFGLFYLSAKSKTEPIIGIVGWFVFTVIITLGAIAIIFIWAVYQSKKGNKFAKNLLKKQPFKIIMGFERKMNKREKNIPKNNKIAKINL